VTEDLWRPSADLDALRKRAGLAREIRSFFASRDVLEVVVPTLGPTTVTDPDVEAIAVPGFGFLQTSPEYYMKRLLAAGAPSIYSFGPVFRRDEQGRQHSAEFTMLEWYRLDFDEAELMREVSELVDLVLGAAPYDEVSYADLVIDPTLPRADLDLRFAEACAALNPGRHFVVDYPADQAALARLKPSGAAARFELIVDGVEIANGYWELADPTEHRRRFAEDLDIRRVRELDAHDVDEAFLAALEHGLPNCAGVALGFDRLVMLALGAQDIKSVQSF
jgi:lysyl-tRNA synthetase class 2